MEPSLDGRFFAVVQNSETGQVGDGTVFRFTERDDSIQATYSGGGIQHGTIVGRRTSSESARLLYQCVTGDGELRAGEAEVAISEADGRVALEMDWRWLTGGRESGSSRYVECADDPSSADLLPWAARAADEYLSRTDERPVFPPPEAVAALEAFDEPLPEKPSPARETLRLLDDVGSPATVQQVGGRYFGFVNGGVHPPALAARVLADAWDQNAAMAIMSPVVETLERVTETWLADLLGLPEGTACGFVSGTATSLVGGVATARDALYRRRGIDTREQGLLGQEPLRVIVGGQAHGAARRALALVGLGSQRVEVVPVDGQGRLDASKLPPLDDFTLVLCQAGNVSSGAFDPVGEVCERAREVGAWVHVDGAFGLWAGASPRTRPLFDGIETADSWSCDAHKTLNAPYDSGLLLVRDGDALRTTLAAAGSYFVRTGRDGMDHTVAMSRRARVVELWTILRTLGRHGIAERIDALCAHARRFADGLEAAGFRRLNDVVFNQTLVACDTPEQTEEVLRRVQASGECWCGGSEWQGEPAIRVSVCSWATTAGDIDRSVAAFARALDEVRSSA